MAGAPTVSRTDAVTAIGRSVLGFWALLVRGVVHQPRRHVGGRLSFADGSSARVFRETAIAGRRSEDPAVLVVEFRLRAVPRWAHRLFERVSVLNTPLFAGFPGFISKLWLGRDQNDVYRGIYEWDGAERAAHFAQALRWILAVVSVPGSIAYHIAGGETRSEFVAEPEELVDAAVPDGSDSWWRVS